MVLVDTSIWIELLRGSTKYQIKQEELPTVCTCPPVIQEVLQGIRDSGKGKSFRQQFLSIIIVGDPVPLDLYLLAADIYSSGRARGVSIRSSIDCLIAAIAMRYSLPVWHHDRDFDKIASFTDLKIMERFSP